MNVKTRSAATFAAAIATATGAPATATAANVTATAAAYPKGLNGCSHNCCCCFCSRGYCDCCHALHIRRIVDRFISCYRISEFPPTASKGFAAKTAAVRLVLALIAQSPRHFQQKQINVVKENPKKKNKIYIHRRKQKTWAMIHMLKFKSCAGCRLLIMCR